MKLMRAMCVALAFVGTGATAALGAAWIANRFDEAVSPWVFLAITSFEAITFIFYIYD